MNILEQLITLVEDSTGTDVNELMMSLVNNNLDNERMDYNEQIRLRDDRIRLLDRDIAELNEKLANKDGSYSPTASNIPNCVTVRDLKLALDDVPDYLMIVISSDSEGNNISPMSASTFNGEYIAYSNCWSGQMYSRGQSKDATAIPALVLYPVQ